MKPAKPGKDSASIGRRGAGSHRFAVGQMVCLKRQHGLSRAPSATYRITALLPPRDSSPQYRIRNDQEQYERVATQDTLEPADALDNGKNSEGPAKL
jgi:hypothetical protein